MLSMLAKADPGFPNRDLACLVLVMLDGHGHKQLLANAGSLQKAAWSGTMQGRT